LREYGRWLTVKYISAFRQQGGHTQDDINTKNQYNFPSRLTNLSITPAQTLTAVSTGSAEGVLKSADQILLDDRNIILYTKVLSPELTKYFPQISGIVSEQGGLLSHLAIIAREKNLPVLVNYNNKFALGTKVKIDCEAQSIKVI
jgi:pyruvate,water dikinase